MTLYRENMLTEWEQRAHEEYNDNEELRLPVMELPVWEIVNRADASKKRVMELKEDMAENSQKRPIWVHRLFGRWRVIEGRHRLLAARELGWETIKAQDVTDYSI